MTLGLIGTNFKRFCNDRYEFLVKGLCRNLSETDNSVTVSENYLNTLMSRHQCLNKYVTNLFKKKNGMLCYSLSISNI